MDNKTLVRQQVLRIGKELLKSKFEHARHIGNGLLELVDDQAVRATISWSDFIRESNALVQTGRESFLEQMERTLKSWA